MLHVHAFAEEMNKSRRMVARSARAMATAGFAVLQIDLLGCGDSDGDFADGSWDAWQADVYWGAAWLLQRYNAPLWLWGQRAGALLAARCVSMIGRECHLLFWNPLLQGKAIVQQFVRMKAAAEWASGDGRSAGQWVKAELAAGRVVEIAGYGLNPSLARDLESAVLTPPVVATAPRLIWLDVAGRDDEAILSPAAERQLTQWRSAGYRVSPAAVAGPAFWQTVEIEDAPALIDATVQSLCDIDLRASPK